LEKKDKKEKFKVNEENVFDLPTTIPQKGTEFYILTNPLQWIPAGLAIYGMIFPMVILDISTQIYQFVFFGLQGIPKVKRSDYIVVERWNLPNLGLWKRLNCAYCDYANGLAAWVKQVVAQTEIHSCAIKNSTTLLGQDHTDQYWDREKFK
jgi:hypothetical protein